MKVLGTIITEWDEGKKICSEILRDANSIEAFVDKCVEISSALGFEGWLVNIENTLDKVCNTRLGKRAGSRLRERAFSGHKSVCGTHTT